VTELLDPVTANPDRSVVSANLATRVAEATALWHAVFGLTDSIPLVPTEDALLRVALDLGAARFGGPLSTQESELLSQAHSGMPTISWANDAARSAIVSGSDPLGDAFCALRSAAVRRHSGAVYTPSALVRPMVDWVLRQSPSRIVDAGAGSGRFTLEIARRNPKSSIIAVDSDPVATLMTRAGLAALNHKTATVLHADYTTLLLYPVRGKTAFIGNPPYVRHHALSAATKAWAQEAASRGNQTISGLAGLHAYFFLATSLIAKPGDIGCFVTSSEWLDVNYGSIIRSLLLDRLGGVAIQVVDPTVLPFGETATTATISCFQIGSRPKAIRLKMIKGLDEIQNLESGPPILRERLVETSRWSTLIRTAKETPSGYVELGELCRVHRGAVTGRNSVWVTDGNVHGLPESVLFPSVTKAKELFQAGAALSSVTNLRRVIDLPLDLDVFDSEVRREIERFLQLARRQGASDGYVARSRRAWWSVGLREPAPILATYMARRPPAFVRNLAEARHINIAHGLYPREQLPDSALDRLAHALSTTISTSQGRTYAGGLTKFEPREMERVPVPDLPLLLA